MKKIIIGIVILIILVVAGEFIIDSCYDCGCLGEPDPLNPAEKNYFYVPVYAIKDYNPGDGFSYVLKDELQCLKTNGKCNDNYNRSEAPVGFTFEGLCDKAQGGEMYFDKDMEQLLSLAEGMKLYEYFTPKEYTIRFNVEPGWAEVDPITVKAGEEIKLPKIEKVANGKSFVGWKTKNDVVVSNKNEMLDEYYWLNTFSGVYATAANHDRRILDLYMVCEDAKFNLTLVVNGINHNMTVDYGQTLSSLDLSQYIEEIEASGESVFCFWSQYRDIAVEYNTPIYTDITLYPITKTRVNITFHENYDNKINVVPYAQGDQINFYKPTRPGYEFIGWYDTELLNRQPITYASAYGDTDYYAAWREVTYNVTFVCANESFAPMQYNYGQVIELPKPTPSDPMYEFKGWCENADLSDAPILTITSSMYGDKKLYAKFVGKEINVSFVTSSNGMSDKKVNYNSSYKLPVPVRDYYEFLGWFDGEDESATALTDKTGASYGPLLSKTDITVYAHWKIQSFTITFVTGDGSPIAPVVYDYGTVPTRPDDPVYGDYFLLGWFLSEEDNDEYLFNSPIKSDITLYARYYRSVAISSAEDLNKIAILPSGNYHLTKNINLSADTWVPIDEFSGVLDGKGYKIFNFGLTNADGNANNQLAFIRVNKGTIRNLTLENVTANFKNNSETDNVFGLLVASNAGMINNCKLENCSAIINVSSTVIRSHTTREIYCFGGFCGKNTGSVIKCDASGLKIEHHGSFRHGYDYVNAAGPYHAYFITYVGGVCGINEANISSCNSSANIVASSQPSGTNAYCVCNGIALLYVGGIAGVNRESGKCSNLYSNSQINVSSSIGSYASVYDNVGGVIGENAGKLEQSYSNAKITDTSSGASANPRIGGVVGSVKAGGTVNNCYYDDLGEVRLKASKGLGGVVGLNAGKITNCYANIIFGEGNVSASGAFAGYTESTSTIANCFVNATTTSGKLITDYGYGMFVGVYAGVLTNSYFATDVAVDGQQGSAKPLSNILKRTFLLDTLYWDEGIWIMQDGSFPKLR